jgi:hypothetical protein
MRLRLLVATICFLLGRNAIAQEIAVFSNSSAAVEHPVVVVEVPTGWSIIGGGATTNFNDTAPGQLLVSSYPLDGNHWIASSTDQVAPYSTVLTAYAIAVKNPSLYDVKIFASQSVQNEHPSASVSVAGGYVMTGGGAKADPMIPGQLLVASYPSDQSTWAARSTDHIDPSSGTVTAYAIGIKPLKPNTPAPQIKLFTATSGATPVAHPRATVNLDAGFVATCGGAATGDESNLLVEDAPVGTLAWTAWSKDHVYSAPTTITVYLLGWQNAQRHPLYQQIQ